MNFKDLQERCFQFLGLPDTSQGRPDWRVQMVRDAINSTLREIGNTPPFVWNLVRESTVAVVASTNTYYLNDWCQHPLSLWTEDVAAHKVKFTDPRKADRDGSRNPSASYGSLGPWNLTWYPRNNTALKSGASGVTAGASATEGSTTVTKAGGTAWDATDVGRMLRLNGEDADYQITAVAGADSCTVDRSIKARLTSVASTNTGAGYTTVRWEVAPPGRFRIKILPTPTSATPLYYRYLALPRVLINDDETPEIQTEYHDIIWKGALKILASMNEDGNSFGIFAQEYDHAIELLKMEDQDTVDCEDSPNYETSLRQEPRGLPIDVYSRRGLY